MKQMGIGLTIFLLVSFAASSFIVHPSLEAASIYIRTNGDVDPPSAPILRNGDTYTLTDDIVTNGETGIEIERNNIILDGAGHSIQGADTGTGIDMLSRNNVTLRNAYITAFNDGIHLSGSSNCQIIQSTLTGNEFYGLGLYDSSYNNIAKNNFTANKWVALNLASSIHNSIDRNQMVANNYALELVDSSYNSITGNTVIDNTNGIELSNSQNNSIFHNNFVNQTRHASTQFSLAVWDNGYPSGGNYWSDYNGTDANGDDIGDTPYVIDENNVDRYPLMYVHWNPADINHDLKVDIKDVSIAAKAFGTVPGDTFWNPRADITGPIPLVPDGKVDIRDVSLIAKSFGKKYQ